MKCQHFKMQLILPFLLCVMGVRAGAQTITTFAGNGYGAGLGTGVGGYSGDGGQATLAELWFPGGIATDRMGNVYIADEGNNRLRKVDTAGIITTIAGNGSVFFSGTGPATAAQLAVGDVALDSAGNMYIASYYRICKINTSGIVTSVAGNGINGYAGDGGPATAAELGNLGMACDMAGNLYLADANRIRKVNHSTGIITTIAGNGTAGVSGDGGPASAAELNGPGSISVDDSANIYISDGERIREINTSGIISTIAGSATYGFYGDGGPATAAEFKGIWKIAFDGAHNLYIADELNNRIRKINTAGIITTIAGNGTWGYTGDGDSAISAELRYPVSVALDDSGNVYIGDQGNNVTRKISYPYYGPHFMNGRSQALAVCENTAGDSINSLLAVMDSTTTHAATWSVITLPGHGTVTANYSFISTDSIFNTSGLSYTPAAGYYGNDSFRVRVTDGVTADTTTIHITVNAVLAAITGATSICTGRTVALSDLITGGTWSSSDATIASIDAVSGTATGTGTGSATISYSAPVSCGVTFTAVTITVNLSPAAITGISNICPGTTTTLSESISGGTWSSSNTAQATVNTAGMLTVASAGTPVITYQLSTGCSTTATVTVNALPLLITGTNSVCPGSTILLSDASSGGVWSSGATAIASAGSGGAVSGVSPGAALITYTLGTGCMRSVSITVNPLPAAITGGSTACPGAVTTLTDATSGGMWNSSNTAVASVGSGGAGSGVYGVAPGTATISYIITGTGCAAAAVITVNPLPLAITGALPAGGLCIGATATLADGTSGGVWSPATGGIAAAGTATGVVAGVSAGTELVTYTLPTGCIATHIVSVNANHVPVAIAGVSSICAGASTTLTDGTTGGIWSSGSTAVATVLPIAIGTGVSGVSPGTAVITYTLSTGCANGVTVTVNPAPAVYTVTGGGGYCAGTGGLPVGLSGSAAGISYQLFYGVTMVGSPLTGTGGALSFGPQTLEEVYTVVASNGATGCSVTMAGTAPVVANPLPVVHTITGGGHYCMSGTGVHIGLDGSATGIDYQLYNGRAPALLLAGTGSTLDFGLITTAGVYMVVARNDTTGCADTMRDTVTVTIDPVVTPAVSLATGVGDTICAGTRITITATAVNGGTSPAYAWSVNGSPVPVSGGAYSYLPSDGDHVAVRLTSSIACAMPDTASGSLTLRVLATGRPAVHITASPGDSVCEGATTRFTAAISYGGTAPTLTWVVNSAIAASGTAYAYLPANHDAVNCVLGSNYQCRTADSGTSNLIIMTVADSSIPVVTVTASPGVNIVHGQGVTLTASATHADADATYQWYINGMPVTGADSPTYSASNFANGDSVSCVLTGNSICNIAGYGWAIFEVNDAVTTPSAQGMQVTVSPNPNKGEFTIRGELGTTGSEEASIEITDLLGQSIYKATVNVPGGRINTRVSTGSTLASGVYILHLMSGGAEGTWRVVVE